VTAALAAVHRLKSTMTAKAVLSAKAVASAKFTRKRIIQESVPADVTRAKATA
jgi:hypothetical protein